MKDIDSASCAEMCQCKCNYVNIQMLFVYIFMARQIFTYNERDIFQLSQRQACMEGMEQGTKYIHFIKDSFTATFKNDYSLCEK